MLTHGLRSCLGQRASQEERHYRCDRADRERDAPAPALELFIGQERLQDDQNEHREQLATNQRHVLKRREKPPVLVQGNLAHVGCAGAVFASNRQALQQPREQQHRGRRDTDRRVSRQDRNQQGTRAHHDDCEHHRYAPPTLVGDPPEQPASDRAHQKPRGKDSSCVQKLRCLVARGKEFGCEIQRRERIDVEVVPLDEISGRPADNRPDAAPRVGAADAVGRMGGGEGGHIDSPLRVNDCCDLAGFDCETTIKFTGRCEPAATIGVVNFRKEGSRR